LPPFLVPQDPQLGPPHPSIANQETFGLYAAAERSNVDVVAALLEHPLIDPNKKRVTGGYTSLYIAAERGHVEVVRLLLDWRSDEGVFVDVNLETDKGATPLYIACEKGHLEVINLILAHPSVEMNKCFKTSFSPFFVACECGHASIVERLLREDHVDVNKPQHQGASPFFMACQKGRLEAVRVLLRSSLVDVNRPRDTGATPLYIACEFNHPEIVRELLQCDRVDPNQQRKGGYTPLFRVCEKGHLDALRIMLQSDRVDVNLGSNKGTTPLYIACERNQIEVVRELLRLPHLDVNRPHDQNFTPFFVACRFGHTEVVQMLMADPRTDVNKPQHQGATPFYIACHFGRVNTVRALLKNTAVDVNFPMRNGGTPFWTAASCGQEAVVKWMLVSGRDVGIGFRWSGNNKTAAQQARHKGHLKIAQLLEDFESNAENVVAELEMDLGIWDKFKSKKEVELLQTQLTKERELVDRLTRENKALRRDNERLRWQHSVSGAGTGKSGSSGGTLGSAAAAVALGTLDIDDDDGEQTEEAPEVSFTVASFTAGDVAQMTENFSPSRKIGEGGQAQVFRGVHAGSDVAVKKFDASSPQELHALLVELEAMKKYQHPHIIPLIGCTSLRDPAPCLVYPLMVNGTLRTHLDGPAEGEKRLALATATTGATSPAPTSLLSWERRLKIALQVARGLAFLHNPQETDSAAEPLLHLDVTSANVLLDENFDARLTDFGLSRAVAAGETAVTKTRAAFGTIGYLCPDFVASGHISPKTDVFAFGVLLAELLTGRPPVFHHQQTGRPVNLSRHIQAAMPKPSSLSPASLVDPEIRREATQATMRILAQLTRYCLEPESESRPTMDEVVVRLESLVEGTSRLCVVCMDNPTNGRMNCGHAVLCFPCAEYLLIREERCPLCRVKVTSVDQGCYHLSFVA